VARAPTASPCKLFVDNVVGRSGGVVVEVGDLVVRTDAFVDGVVGGVVDGGVGGVVCPNFEEVVGIEVGDIVVRTDARGVDDGVAVVAVVVVVGNVIPGKGQTK